MTRESEDEASRSFANVTEAQFRRCLRGMADEMRAYPRGEMRDFLRPRESGKRKLPKARLLSLIAQVSDHFGGRRLDVVSGVRPSRRAHRIV